MKSIRLTLIVLLALGPVMMPLTADAQLPAKTSRIGILGGHHGWAYFLFRPLGLGYDVDWKYVAIDHRFGRDEELPELAQELVQLKVDVVITAGTRAIYAAKQATSTIPIVIIAEGDPVKAGLVASLTRPGGNITGVTTLAPGLNRKRLALLTKIVPGLTRVAVLWNPADPNAADEWKRTKATAHVLGVKLQSLEVGHSDEFDSAFDAAVQKGAGALLVLADPFTFGHAKRITNLAIKSGLPAMYPYRWFVDHAGLMSYGPDPSELSRWATGYVNKILKGAKPAHLPLEQPKKFELVINVKTAKALGLTIPQSVLIRADKIIQ